MLLLWTYCLTKKNASRPIARGATSSTTRNMFVANNAIPLKSPSPAKMSGDNEERVKGGEENIQYADSTCKLYCRRVLTRTLCL